MKTKFKVPLRQELDLHGQNLHDALVSQYGKAPNLLAFVGLSARTLEHQLTIKEQIKLHTFSQKEIEAINLVVSEFTGDQYGLAEHTTWGKLVGLSEDESVEVRVGRHSNPRLNAIVSLAKEIAQTNGRPAGGTVENFFNEGFSIEALIDLVSLIVNNLLFNYISNMTEIEIDFPLAQPLAHKH